MKIRKLLLALALLPPMAAGAQGYPMTIAEVPSDSGFSTDYDAATATWTLTCETNNGTTTVPYFRMNTLDEAVPAEYTSLCFDYRSTSDVDEVGITMYKVFLGSATRSFTLNHSLKAANEWTTYRADLSEQRASNAVRFLNKAGQYQDVRFPGLPVGGAIQVRNLRYDVNEYPFKEVVVDADGATIEAEDFNGSADDVSGHSSRHNQLPEINTAYRHPSGAYFPIYAWGSVDFTGGMGDDAPEFLHKQYQELWDCGFTITQGTAWPGVDRAFLYDGREVNGVYVNLHEGTDLMMICKAGLESYGDVQSNVTAGRESPRLAGWFIKDEPHYKDFPEMTKKVGWIREFDTDHLLYGNLLNISTSMAAIGFGSYDEYIHTYMREVGTGFISYDYYPVRQYDSTGEIYIEPDFFANLEVVAKLAKYYHTSFWAFAHSVASNCGKEGVSYPTPQEDHMRVQIFGNLAYGAQGVQYFTYKCPNPYDGYTYYDAPINLDNEKTDVWYMVQRINRDIHALTWVFLGAEFLRAGHTNATTPQGCMRLTPEMLPQGIASVSSDGPGVCVSMLQNGSNLFMMVLNGDISVTQTVTVVKETAVKRVLMDGTTEASAAGSSQYVLAPGHFALFLVSEDEPATQLREATRYTTDAGYRDDDANVFITPSAEASGGYYLAAMGDPSWTGYSAILPDDGSRTITREQAIANWGATFNYTVDVAADVTVNISVGHSVPWSEYSLVASEGVAPGYAYVVDGNPSLNWPKQYAAAMTLAIDGATLTPADQPLRPAISSPDAGAYDALLADKGSWTATRNADATPSDVLYLWPTSSADDGLTPHYNPTPDYQDVILTAGTHRITVTSLCYPWHFDNLLLTVPSQSAIGEVARDGDVPVDGPTFNLLGIECRGDLAPGVYVRNGKKIIVR